MIIGQAPVVCEHLVGHISTDQWLLQGSLRPSLKYSIPSLKYSIPSEDLAVCVLCMCMYVPYHVHVMHVHACMYMPCVHSRLSRVCAKQTLERHALVGV